MSTSVRVALLLAALVVFAALAWTCAGRPGAGPHSGSPGAGAVPEPEVGTTAGDAGRRRAGPGEVPPASTRVRLSVRVATPPGDAIAGVEVAVHGADPGASWVDGWVAAATTDEAGCVAIDVEPGAYTVRAFHRDWLVPGREVDVRGATEVRLTAGRGQRVPLRFLDTDGKPIPGVQVWNPDAVVPAVAVSDTEGRVVLVRRGGTYPLLHLDAPGYHEQSLPLVQAGGFADRAPHDVVLHAGPPLRVLVTEADGTPIAEAEIHANRRRPRTGADGRAVIAAAYLEPQRTIVAYAPDGRRGEAEAFDADGRRLEDLTIVIEPGRAVQGRVVLGDSDVPVPDAVVRVADRAQRFVRVTTSDVGGRFRLERLIGGNGDGVEAMAFATSLAPDEDGWRSEIDLTDGELVLRVVPTITLTGTAVNAEGSPVAGARVWVEPPGRPFAAVGDLPDWNTTTRPDGTFALEGVPRIARLYAQVQAAGSGIAIVSAELDALSEKPTALLELGKVVLPERFDLDPRFVDADGAPLAQGMATIRWNVGVRSSPMIVRPIVHGRIEPVRDLPVPWVILEVDGLGLVPVSRRATRETKEVLVEVGCRATGRVTRAATGEPVAGVWVILTSTEHPSYEKGREAGGQTDEEGAFVATGLRRGRYRVAVGETKADVAEVLIDGNAVEVGRIRVE